MLKLPFLRLDPTSPTFLPKPLIRRKCKHTFFRMLVVMAQTRTNETRKKEFLAAFKKLNLKIGPIFLPKASKKGT